MSVVFQNAAGDRVSLQPVGYEFSQQPKDRWDDFLVIRGQVELGDGRAWVFQDPAMTALEATSVAPWLRRARETASTAVPSPSTRDWPDSDAAMLSFVEPVIAFSVARHDLDVSVLRVHLSLGASPPWQSMAIHGYFLLFPMSSGQFAAAAQRWEMDSAGFPMRASTHPY